MVKSMEGIVISKEGHGRKNKIRIARMKEVFLCFVWLGTPGPTSCVNSRPAGDRAGSCVNCFQQPPVPMVLL